MPAPLAFFYATAFALVAALAVDTAFGAAFIHDPVAYGSSAYCAALGAAFFGGRKDSSHWTQRRWLRSLIAALSSAAWVYLLRGPLLVRLPWSDFQTSGFSPYVVLVAVVLTPVLGLEALYRARQAPPAAG